jgi:hypothetical protein
MTVSTMQREMRSLKLRGFVPTKKITFLRNDEGVAYGHELEIEWVRGSGWSRNSVIQIGSKFSICNDQYLRVSLCDTLEESIKLCWG